jgi:AAA+ ATPase superfamily predicted ATPase
MAKREAPFRVGGIVEPPYFVGREDDLRVLGESLRNLSQNVLLLAPRRFGKSSLLWNLRRSLADTPDLLLPYVNCRDMASPGDLFRGLVQPLLEELSEKRKLSGLWEKFRLVFSSGVLRAVRALEEIGGSIGEWGQVYLRFREAEVDEKALVRAAFSYPKRIAAEYRVRVVFLLDEFQEVAAFDRYVFDALKKELDQPGDVRFVFSGSSLGLLREVFLREDSPLFLMVSRYELGPLSAEEAVPFVQKRLALAGYAVEKGAAERIYELTGGIPFYLQKLGLLLVQRLWFSGKKSVGKREVDEAFEEMLAELDSEFEVRWLSEFSPLQRRILRVLAKGPAGPTALAQALGMEPQDISSSLARLRAEMVLRRTEAGYALTDVVFARWLSKD